MSGMNREATENMLFANRTSKAIIKNIKTVRGAHVAAPPIRLECTGALLGVIRVTSSCDWRYALQRNSIPNSGRVDRCQKQHRSRVIRMSMKNDCIRGAMV